MKRVGLVVIFAAVAIGGTAPWAAAPVCHFTVAADGATVRDGATGFVWQRVAPAQTYDWSGAKSYCVSLNALNLGGFASGWRLPNIKELQTLVDPRVLPPGPTIDGTAFPSTPPTWFWSSSSCTGTSGHAWTVYFSEGITLDVDATGAYSVRCVR